LVKPIGNTIVAPGTHETREPWRRLVCGGNKAAVQQRVDDPRYRVCSNPPTSEAQRGSRDFTCDDSTAVGCQDFRLHTILSVCICVLLLLYATGKHRVGSRATLEEQPTRGHRS